MPILEIPSGRVIFFNDVQPENTDTAVLIPLRFVLEKMGAIISWHGETKTVFADFNGKVSAADARLILRKAARLD